MSWIPSSRVICGSRRPQLSLIITSATLDGEKFAAYYDGCPVFNVAGRSYDVDIIHSKEMHDKDYRKACLSHFLLSTVRIRVPAALLTLPLRPEGQSSRSQVLKVRYLKSDREFSPNQREMLLQQSPRTWGHVPVVCQAMYRVASYGSSSLCRSSLTGNSSFAGMIAVGKPVDDAAQAAVDVAMGIHVRQPPGDILLFLTGQQEIEKVLPSVMICVFLPWPRLYHFSYLAESMV